MKRIMIMLLACGCILSACSMSGDKEAEHKDKPEKKVTQKQPTEKDASKINLHPEIFTKKAKNKTISEAEMKRDIQQYLNADHDLTKISEHYQDAMYSEKGLSKEEANHIKQAGKLTDKNDNNFADYINQNKLPKGYDRNTHKISRYITTSNQYLRDMEEKIDTVMENSKDGKVSIKEIGDIGSDSDVVNGKQQKQIEDWLDEKGIQTRAFTK